MHCDGGGPNETEADDAIERDGPSGGDAIKPSGGETNEPSSGGASEPGGETSEPNGGGGGETSEPGDASEPNDGETNEPGGGGAASEVAVLERVWRVNDSLRSGRPRGIYKFKNTANTKAQDRQPATPHYTNHGSRAT